MANYDEFVEYIEEKKTLLNTLLATFESNSCFTFGFLTGDLECWNRSHKVQDGRPSNYYLRHVTFPQFPQHFFQYKNIFNIFNFQFSPRLL